ncbi:MAG: monovalent cation/H(+) antiporter subunit G [Microthrixaceae bacterium]|nr:monovalent cation/H(+) antiporter subunit G [Microthrixaceae bacterium]
MPDAYSRIHVATKPATLAVVCTVGAAILQVHRTDRCHQAPAGRGAAVLDGSGGESHVAGHHERRPPPAEPWALDEFSEPAPEMTEE